MFDVYYSYLLGAAWSEGHTGGRGGRGARLLFQVEKIWKKFEKKKFFLVNSVINLLIS